MDRVWFGAVVVLLAFSTCATATTKSESLISATGKPKREAPLSSGYHGPSYKYLPPAPASIGISGNGYDSYSSHSSNSASFGASGSAGLGYDFGGASVHASAPKVETYIVQTEPAHGGYSGGVSSHGGSAYSGGSSGHFGAGLSSGGGSGGGYRYSSGASSSQAGTLALLGHSNFGGGSSGVSSSSKFHTKARPQIQTYIIAANSLANGGGSSFGGGHAVHSSGGSGSSAGFGSGGYQYTPSFGGASHSSAGGFGGAHGSGFGGGHGGSSSFGGHSSGGFGAHGGNSVTFNSLQGYSYSGNAGSGGAAFGLGSRSHGSLAGHGSGSSGATISFAGGNAGYSGHEYVQSAPSIPSTNYGIPAGPAITSYQGASGAGNSYHSSGYDTPSYAAGHKGLGHFSFSASKPHALNVDFGSSGHSGHSAHSVRAPFKPSTLLGTSHEVSAPASQYLPPTSAGYEYQSESVLHSGTSAAGSASTAINEPNSAYLPPVSTPGSSYLPPHHH
ncbi:loricrin [Anastrepha ludens]|uniref:loricrin n=1 Tax=Anastrepha ludens TaxID=28586 RepID=UPI0023AF38E6|nr:loricrin [Anastrepha ludens]